MHGLADGHCPTARLAPEVEFMNAHWPRRGLYLITPDERDTPRLLSRTHAVLGSAALLQYRNKSADGPLRLQQASAMLELCRSHRVPMIVNDDTDIAATIGADGVHLGENDDGLENARRHLGKDALIGISCYDDLQRAEGAARCQADYLAFGAFFASPTKPGARRATPAL
ncbi:MAG: thiamine phosphate synthase, partial [Luteimonas sp.]